jgi:GT2 family glycosyltransferase
MHDLSQSLSRGPAGETAGGVDVVDVDHVDLDVVVVSWNTRDRLIECLEALPAAIGPLRADFWVVDNASSDGSAEAIRAAFPSVHVLENCVNLGYAAAINQAVAVSHGRYVLALNADARPLPGSVEALVRFASQRARAGVVGPRLLSPDGRYQASCAPFPTLSRELLAVTGLGRRLLRPCYPDHGPAPDVEPRAVDCPVGACFLARRAAFRQVGLLDERYFMYSEELDFFWRLYRAGWERWYLPAAQVVHAGAESTRQRPAEMYRALFRSKVAFFARHRGRLQGTVLRLLLFLLLRLRWLVGSLGSPLSPSGRRPLVSWADLAPDSARQPAVATSAPGCQTVAPWADRPAPMNGS